MKTMIILKIWQKGTDRFYMGPEITDCKEMKRIISSTEDDAIVMFGYHEEEIPKIASLSDFEIDVEFVLPNEEKVKLNN